MIDWITAKIPCEHASAVSGGRLVSINPDGSVEWDMPKARAVEGSHASNILVQTLEPWLLRLSGNPAKWLQGHNLFGSGDLIGLVAATMERIVPLLNLSPTPADREAWRVGKYDVTRVDCTAMWNLRTRGDVRSYLRALEMQAKSRHGRPMCRGGTVYFGKHSRRWSLKAYSKGDEVETAAKGHRLARDIPHIEKLHEYANTALRFELVLRSMALRERGLARASTWENIRPLDLLRDAVAKLDMADKFSLTPEILDGLPPRLILLYEAWKNGKDLRQLFAARTFYRYRKELLKRGIDINIRQPSTPDNVVPLVRALRPEAIAEVPDWAKGTGLYFDTLAPGKRKASNP